MRRRNGFSLIELLLVFALMGLMFSLAMPRLSAFLAGPRDRELRSLDHFVLRASRRAIREPLVPENQPDAKPLRIKIVPPRNLTLIRADTELAMFEMSHFRIEDVEQDGKPTVKEPEFPFSPLGLLPPFSIHLAAARTPGGDQIRWEIDRLGAIRVKQKL